MNELFLVMVIRTDFPVKDCLQIFPGVETLPLKFARGMVGACPIFGTELEADAYIDTLDSEQRPAIVKISTIL